MTHLTRFHTVARMRGVIAASALLLGFPSVSVAEQPAVARPVYVAEGHRQTASTVFFLRVEDEIGVAAIGTAHHFDLEAVASAGEVRFRLGKTQRHVGVSSRYLVTPGRPFSEAGAAFGDDYIVFALDAPPHEVRTLEASREPPRAGQRVRILGVPAAIAQDEDDIFGSVVSFAPKRIEVDLDVRADLRGWGGAPVLTYPEGLVIGLLEAQWPEGGSLRLGVAPIGGILEALDQPLDAGRGLPFASVETPAPGVRNELED